MSLKSLSPKSLKWAKLCLSLANGIGAQKHCGTTCPLSNDARPGLHGGPCKVLETPQREEKTFNSYGEHVFHKKSNRRHFDPDKEGK